MSVPAPHFVLISQAETPRRVGAAVNPGAHAGNSSATARNSGRWRFVLQSADGQTCLEAEDEESEGSAERLQLLAIVRGLEALDEPSRVTLVSAGRSISRAFSFGLDQWRESDWQWERYGQRTPVKNDDLWRRIDRAMAIHDVRCQTVAAATDDLAQPADPLREAADVRIIRHRGRKLRIDRPAEKSESRKSKHETNSQCQFDNDVRDNRVGNWLFRFLNLFRISTFVLRVFRFRPAG
jgi:ribonuclease HI